MICPHHPPPVQPGEMARKEMAGFNSKLCFPKKPRVPSGKPLHNYGKIHHFIAGKTHEISIWPFSIAILLVITRGFFSIF